MNDEKRNNLPHFELTGSVLNCCFEAMKELGEYKTSEELALEPVPF